MKLTCSLIVLELNIEGSNPINVKINLATITNVACNLNSSIQWNAYACYKFG